MQCNGLWQRRLLFLFCVAVVSLPRYGSASAGSEPAAATNTDLAWQREEHLEEAKGDFADQLAEFKWTLLTGGSEARYRVLRKIQSNNMAEILDGSFVSAMQVAGDDSDPKVRNEVARVAGRRWIWSAKRQDPSAIELMLKLSSDTDREVRYNAVYYGLSVVRNKREAIVVRLVDLALGDQERSFYDRIVWGLSGPMGANSQPVEYTLRQKLEAGTESERAVLRHLYKEVLQKEAPPIRRPSGQVVDPNGNPVTGAQVAVCTWDRAITIVPPRLRLNNAIRRNSQIGETDAQGRFSFPELLDDFAITIVASHEAGFARVRGDELTASTPMRLEPWAQVQGTLYVGRKPAAGEVMYLALGGWSSGTEWPRYYRRADTNTNGRFLFHRVVPGWLEIGRGALMERDSSRQMPLMSQPVYVKPGETLEIAVGGVGRPVMGKLIPPMDSKLPANMTWDAVQLRRVISADEPPRPAGYDWMTESQRDEWYFQWTRTLEGRTHLESVSHDPNNRFYSFSVDKDNSFRIEDVIPGTYHFSGYRRPASQRPSYQSSGPYCGSIEVPPMPEAYSDEPLDVGEILAENTQPGELLPGGIVEWLDRTDASGRVLGPDGEPVAGAHVALVKVGVGMVRTSADAQGRFRMEGEGVPEYDLIFIAVHPAGLAGVSFVEFVRTRQIRLRPWESEPRTLDEILALWLGGVKLNDTLPGITPKPPEPAGSRGQ